MAPPTSRALHEALVRALEPVTRWRYPFPGDGSPVRVNDTGVDVWENHVGDVRIDPDRTAHAYLFIQTSPGGWAQTRAVPAATVSRWRPIITYAGGTPTKVGWALDRTRPVLDGLTLTSPGGTPLTGPLHEGFSRLEQYDPGPLQLDEDPSPPRWYVPIQYATTAH